MALGEVKKDKSSSQKSLKSPKRVDASAQFEYCPIRNYPKLCYKARTCIRKYATICFVKHTAPNPKSLLLSGMLEEKLGIGPFNYAKALK